MSGAQMNESEKHGYRMLERVFLFCVPSLPFPGLLSDLHNSPLKGIGVRDFYRNSIGDFSAMPVFAVFDLFDCFFDI